MSNPTNWGEIFATLGKRFENLWGASEKSRYTPRSLDTDSGPVTICTDTRVLLLVSGTYAPPTLLDMEPKDEVMRKFLAQKRNSVVCRTLSLSELVKVVGPWQERTWHCFYCEACGASNEISPDPPKRFGQLDNDYFELRLFSCLADLLPGQTVVVYREDSGMKKNGHEVGDNLRLVGDGWTAFWMSLMEKPQDGTDENIFPFPESN